MSSLSATQSDGYYLPPEYFESGKYKKVSRNKFASETNNAKKLKAGHNQWFKHGVVRFELPEKASCVSKHSAGARFCCACTTIILSHTLLIVNFIRWSVVAAGTQLGGEPGTMPEKKRPIKRTFRRPFSNLPWNVGIAASELLWL